VSSVLASLLAGCGTMLATSDKDVETLCAASAKIEGHALERFPRIYSGVTYDIWAVGVGGHGLLMVADIPFSLVADTLILPYTAYGQITTGSRTCQRN